MAKTHDGSDFKHRQRILPQYQTMALSKKRLKFTLILHLFLSVLMAFKLLPNILDILDIFWQPIEELYIPAAHAWEWVWFGGMISVFVALRAVRSNNALLVKAFLAGTLFTSIFPIIYCAQYYSSDFRTYVITRDATKTSEVWKNYPVALYWYVFIVVASQIHGFELYFGWELLSSLSSPRSVSNKSK